LAFAHDEDQKTGNRTGNLSKLEAAICEKWAQLEKTAEKICFKYGSPFEVSVMNVQKLEKCKQVRAESKFRSAFLCFHLILFVSEIFSFRFLFRKSVKTFTDSFVKIYILIFYSEVSEKTTDKSFILFSI
jgi:hypothetical protein